MLHCQVERSASVKPGDCWDLNTLLSVEFPPLCLNSCLTTMSASVDDILSCKFFPCIVEEALKKGTEAWAVVFTVCPCAKVYLCFCPPGITLKQFCGGLAVNLKLFNVWECVTYLRNMDKVLITSPEIPAVVKHNTFYL